MGFFSNLAKGIGNVVKDVVKVSVAATVMPVNSVTGHKYNPALTTGVGKVVGGTALAGAANVNILAKSFADTITGGAASKLVNKVRSADNQESMGHYGEQGIGKGGIKWVDSVIDTENEVSGVLGSLYGSKVASENKTAGAIQALGTQVNAAMTPAAANAGAPALSASMGLDAQGNLVNTQNSPNMLLIVGAGILVFIFLIFK